MMMPSYCFADFIEKRELSSALLYCARQHTVAVNLNRRFVRLMRLIIIIDLKRVKNEINIQISETIYW